MSALQQFLTVLLISFLTAAFVPTEATLQTELSATAYNALNLRSGPGTDYAPLGVVRAGETVRLIGRAAPPDEWVLAVTTTGQQGWLYTPYLVTMVDQLGLLPVVGETQDLTIPEAQATSSQAASPPQAQPLGDPTRIRAIFQRGQQLGNRSNVFSKIGDSITTASHFLNPIGWGTYQLHDYGYLQPTITYFSAQGVRTANSFANESLAAGLGWTTQSVLDPARVNTQYCEFTETPLTCELRTSKPAIALIMLGTNDVAQLSSDAYRANLDSIVRTAVDMGVIPVLSTIPPRPGYDANVDAFNQIIRATSAAYGTPLWDYYNAMVGLPGAGLSDGVHPSWPPGTHSGDVAAAVDFTTANLQFGYTVRNLTALQLLDSLRQYMTG